MKDKHIFEQSAGERAFLLCNGREIDSIKGLHKELVGMDDDVFNHHVNPDRNDFSMWINNVFNRAELADRISKLRNKEEIRKAMGEWISSVIHEKYKTRRNEKGYSSKLNKAKKVIFAREKKPKKEELSTDEGYEPVKFERKDLEGLERPKYVLSGIIDFIIGFIVGALAMVLFVNMV